MSATLPEAGAPQRVLLCRTDRLGDLILALPCVALVKAMFPGCRVDLLVAHYTAPIARLFVGADEILEVKSKTRASTLTSLLRPRSYDAAIALFPTFSLARSLAAAGIPLRAGIAYRWYSRLFNYRHREHRKLNLKHEAEYNLCLTYSALARGGQWEDLLLPADLFPLKLEIPDIALQRAAAIVNAAAGEKVVALHPGGSGSAHRWKVEYFAELAQRLVPMSGIRLVITGGVGEESMCKMVSQAGGSRAVDLCGKLTLPELAAVYRRCDLLISNSTGPLHLARALGTQVLGLFPHDTAMSPQRWGPYGLPDRVLTAPGLRSLDNLEVPSVLNVALQRLRVTQ
jgi:ADP-heptose:LPS heptosyltransferase